jgi:hypothetical protein
MRSRSLMAFITVNPSALHRDRVELGACSAIDGLSVSLDDLR